MMWYQNTNLMLK